MTCSDFPPTPEVPESTASELHALYRAAAEAEPGPMLDKSILDAARAELRADRAAKRRTPWWRGWMTAASAVAVAAVGLSLTWRVMDEQERSLREEMDAGQATGATADKPLSAQAPVRQGPADTRAVPAAPLPAAPVPAAPAAMAPAPVEEAAKQSERAAPEELREKRDAATAAGSAANSARALGRMKAENLGASGEAMADSLAPPPVGSSAKSLAAPGVDAATPEAWLKHIRELRAAGRGAEAAQSLARLRARYPDFVLPDDLK